MQTYLLTGGAGNLACQMTFLLAHRGIRSVLFDVAEQPVAATSNGCQYIRGDVTNTEQLESVLRDTNPQTILHFASLLSAKSEQDRRAAWSINVDGAFRLMEVALRNGVNSIFFPSSLAAYGGEVPTTVPENFPQWPDGLYGVTKVAIERLGVYYHRQHGLDFRCIRLPIVVSPYAHPGAASSYASLAISEAAIKGQFTFHVRPTCRPAIIYIKEVLQAILNLIAAPRDRLTQCVYNIQAISPTAAELAEAIRKFLPDAQMEFQPRAKVANLIDSWPIVFDDIRARTDWDWQPSFNLTTMVQDFIQELGNH